MASIDGLLSLLTRDGFETLVLEPGHRPRFQRNGTEVVGRQPLDSALVTRLLREVAPADPDTAAPPGVDQRRFDYTLDGRRYRFRVAAAGEGYRVVVSEGGRNGSAAEPSSATVEGGRGGAVERQPPAGGEATPAAPGTEATPAAPTAPAAPAIAADPAPAIATAPASANASAPAPPNATGPGAPGVGRTLQSIPELLGAMLEAAASDLHLTSNEPPRLRVDGDLDALPGYQPPSSRHLQELLEPITPERNLEELTARNDTDFAFPLPGKARFRVNLFRDHHGLGAVFRQIPEKIPSPEELGLPQVLRDLAHLSKGLVLVTGPTGSGKSTTLAAILDVVNRSRRDHIVTIEDPIEFVHPSKLCLVNQREVGVHTTSFKQALRAALRQDPDIVLVGEMRDLETISIAIETAETGHLVFGTLHTTTAPSTVERLVNQFPGDRQAQVRMMLADSLRAVVAQTLLKRKGGGRVAAFEILIGTPAISNLIREGKIHQIVSAMQTGRGHGMVILNDALVELVRQDMVEPREAYLKAVYKDTLVQRLRAAGLATDFLDELRAASPTEG